MRSKLILCGGMAVVAFAGCAPVDEGSAFLEGVLPLDRAKGCVADAAGTTFVATALLDIGSIGDPASANNLIVPVKVRTNLPSTFSSGTLSNDTAKSPSYTNYGNTDSNVITFNESEVFFSTDDDRADQRQLQNDGTPVNANTVRVSSVASVVFNQQTQLLTPAAIFVTAITKSDAALLQGENFVATAIQGAAAGGTARVIANIRLAGTTTGGARVETPAFPFPVELCSGCLTDRLVGKCPNPAGGNNVDGVPNPDICVPGQDVPEFVCP